MAIYRGPGGPGDATTDATSEGIVASNAAAAALVSQTAAAASASAAASSASAASSSASSASSSASSATSSASTATTQATNAATSASNAATGSAPSDVGIRITNYHHGHSPNRAIDFTLVRQNGQIANNVPAPISGRVIYAGREGGFGNTVIIEAASAGPGYNKGDRVLPRHRQGRRPRVVSSWHDLRRQTLLVIHWCAGYHRRFDCQPTGAD